MSKSLFTRRAIVAVKNMDITAAQAPIIPNMAEIFSSFIF